MKKACFNSFDYIAGSLNRACRKTPGEQNHFLLLLTLDRAVDFPDTSPLDIVPAEILEILYGKMGRDPWTLAPYFKRNPHVPGHPELRKIFLDEKEIPATLENFSNIPASGPLEGLLLRTPESTRIVFKFDHRFFDGRGAELLIDAWMRQNTSQLTLHGSFLSSPHLNDWKHQFLCGRKLQYKEIEFRRLPGGVASFRSSGSAGNRFRILELSPAETAALSARSEAEAGPFMNMIFLLSLTAKHLAALPEHMGSGRNFVFPTTIGMRGQEDLPPHAVFGNPWSILPLALSRDDAACLKRSIPKLRAEVFRATAEHLPQAYRHAGFLTRIAPFGLLNRIMGKYFRASFGTSMFSYLSETSLQTEFFSIPACSRVSVLNLQHLPVIPPDPGLGFFFNLYRNKLNCTVSCREDSLPEEDLENLSAGLEADLKGTLK